MFVEDKKQARTSDDVLVFWKLCVALLHGNSDMICLAQGRCVGSASSRIK